LSESDSILVLRVEPPIGAAFVQRVEGAEAIVGRSSKVDITVPDRYLSRQQARFFRGEGGWFIEDLGGRNPTVLNGRPVEGPTALKRGDLLVMSGARISVTDLERPGSALRDGRPESGDTSDSLFRPASGFIDSRASPDPESSGGEQLRRQAERLRRLNDFSRALAAPIRLEELLELVLDRAFADLQPEEAVVFLRRSDGEFERAATRRLPGVPDDFLYSRSLVREVTEKELAALVNDASADERFAAAESIQASGIRSLLAAPLLDPEGCPGMIVLNSRAHRRRFSEVDMEELVALAAAAALRIRNISLTEEAAQRRVLEKELSLARQIQMALLPAALPDLEGYELQATNVPNREVSGDLYQVQIRGEGECVLMLADVAGKGMSASLLTASLEALAAGPIEEGLPPEEVFSRVSRRLHARTTPERYATGFIAVLNPSTGKLRWASAGHNPVLLLRANGDLEQLDATGLPLGLLPLGAYTGEDRILDPGDLLVVYTDGITEAANPAGDEYGVERLVELCRRESASGLPALVATLVRELDAFVAGTPYGDDRTFLMLRRLPE